MPADLVSARWQAFEGTRIDEIARLARVHGAIDLALGSPELPIPEELLDAAAEALRDGVHQYTNSWGLEALRKAIAEKVARDHKIDLDPETTITVTCGASEAMLDVMMALGNPGEEIIVFEPFYENYLQAAVASGLVPRYVRLHRPGWCLDERELRTAFNSKTKLIVLNTPNNPTGKVVSREELELIAELCRKWDVVCLSDEVYREMVYDGFEHHSMIEIEGMRERTVILDSLSKSYGVSGWRVGWVVAPPELSHAIRGVHEIASCCAPAPLQAAAVTALRLPREYYCKLRQRLRRLRDHLLEALVRIGFDGYRPQGAYYLMADTSGLGFPGDRAMSDHLIREIGVATVPGSVFYATSPMPNHLIRFCFGKSEDTLRRASERLAYLDR